MAVHLASITFDAADPPTLAAFWAALTGYEVTAAQPPYFAELRGDGTAGPRLMFLKVPEAKTAKNRMHLDLGSPDLDGETERVVALGARLLGHHHEYGVTWASFADPEGNEFDIGLHAHPD